MSWLALDIGGANLKVANGLGYAASYAFAMWRDYAVLPQAIERAILAAPASDCLAVTMTGELADCFETRADGVHAILRATLAAAGGREVRVYLTDQSITSVDSVSGSEPLAASSNWHALACFCGRFAQQGSALLIDIGSTTIDLIPLLDGQPVCSAFTDNARLLANELVYTGIDRSPVCALVHTLPYRGMPCPVAQEVFATAGDVYLLLGDLDEDPNNCDTADLQPRTKEAAARRMGRMVCAGDGQFNLQDANGCAGAAADAQKALILESLRSLSTFWEQPPQTVILSGHGDFLGRQLLDALAWPSVIVSLAERLGPEAARCAPAHALAVLAAESVEP